MEIRRLTTDDMAAILRLCELAGWNQTPRDIDRLLALEPEGCFAACIDGQVVGTTTTTTYGTELAWIGMVLVDPEYRRRGIATALMRTALNYLNRRKVRTVKLDATAAGQPIYKAFGFQPESLLERWDGETSPAEDCMKYVKLGRWADIATTDRAAFGADRSALIQTIIADSGPPLIYDGLGGIVGYAFARTGRLAAYIGPVVTGTIDIARYFLKTVAAGLGRVFVDVDPAFPGANRMLSELGFTSQRAFVRMRLGPAICLGPPRVFAIAGPEIG